MEKPFASSKHGKPCLVKYEDLEQGLEPIENRTLLSLFRPTIRLVIQIYRQKDNGGLFSQ